jgi:lipopolysaccharide/colanic/teichoic acid biosynthesis glycosyltransferase
LSFSQWIRLDLKYIDECSLWTDFKIILKTFPAVLLGRGAY